LQTHQVAEPFDTSRSILKWCLYVCKYPYRIIFKGWSSRTQ